MSQRISSALFTMWGLFMVYNVPAEGQRAQIRQEKDQRDLKKKKKKKKNKNALTRLHACTRRPHTLLCVSALRRSSGKETFTKTQRKRGDKSSCPSVFQLFLLFFCRVQKHLTFFLCPNRPHARQIQGFSCSPSSWTFPTILCIFLAWAGANQQHKKKKKTQQQQ